MDHDFRVAYAATGPVSNNYAGVERRRNGDAGESPTATLKQFPAAVALERIPVPVLAIGQDGAILFVNAPFARMLGYTPDTLLSMQFRQLLRGWPVDESVFSVCPGYPERLVELVHNEGWIVRAKMSESALLRGDDSVALVTFQDLTEHSWADGP